MLFHYSAKISLVLCIGVYLFVLPFGRNQSSGHGLSVKTPQRYSAERSIKAVWRTVSTVRILDAARDAED